MNDFAEDHANYINVRFYRRLAQKCLDAVHGIENGTYYEQEFTFLGNKYTLPSPISSFNHLCKDHIWSYDTDNYRCIICGSWKTLEPITVELPQEILIKILLMAKQSKNTY